MKSGYRDIDIENRVNRGDRGEGRQRKQFMHVMIGGPSGSSMRLNIQRTIQCSYAQCTREDVVTG